MHTLPTRSTFGYKQLNIELPEVNGYKNILTIRFSTKDKTTYAWCHSFACGQSAIKL